MRATDALADFPLSVSLDADAGAGTGADTGANVGAIAGDHSNPDQPWTPKTHNFPYMFTTRFGPDKYGSPY